MGASTAFHLAQLGVTDVVLCERETLGSGSTSKSAGGIRAQFADEINIRIALISLLEFRNFEEKVGEDIDFRETGYLFLLDSDDDVRRFREAVSLQGSLGVLSTELILDEVLELVPQLNTEGLRGATYCPRDGFATPEAVVRGYAAAAAEKGVRIKQGVDVTRIPVLGNKILGVDTTEGRIKTDTVVCTAGVWSKDVGGARRAQPARGGRGALDALHARGARAPRRGAADRRLLDRLLLPPRGARPRLRRPRADHRRRRDAGNAAAADAQRASDPVVLVGLLRDRAGSQRARRRGHGSPRASSTQPASPATASSRAPPIGEHLAERVIGARPTLDLSVFSASRFDHGEPREEAFVI